MTIERKGEMSETRQGEWLRDLLPVTIYLCEECGFGATCEPGFGAGNKDAEQPWRVSCPHCGSDYEPEPVEVRPTQLSEAEVEEEAWQLANYAEAAEPTDWERAAVQVVAQALGLSPEPTNSK